MQGRNPEKKISSKYPLSPIRQERKSSYSTKKLSDKLTDSIKRRSQLLKSNLKKKNFLINDNDYNSMIYDWRKTANASIVKVFALSEKKELDEKSGNLYIKKVVKVQKILQRLTEVSKLSIGQSLYILQKMVEGYEAIFRKLGATTVSLDKCGLNQKGELKVWVNHHFDRNDMSGQILNSEPQIVQKIFEIINLLTDQKLENFRHYVIHNIQFHDWSFILMKNMIQCYIESLRISLPSCITGVKRSEPTEQSINISDFHEELKKTGKGSHKKITSNTCFSMNEFGKNRRKTSCMPSLNTIFSPTTSKNWTHGNFPDFSREQEETSPSKKGFFCINSQYNFTYPLKDGYIGKGESFVSTEHQTNTGSTFMKSRNSSLEKQTQKRFKSRKSENNMVGTFSSENNNFTATFGKSLFGKRPIFPQLQEEQSASNTDNESEKKQKQSSQKKEKQNNFRSLLNRETTVSTYLENSNEKETNPKQNRRKQDLAKLQDELNQLMVLEKETLQNNCWTKKIQGLFNLGNCQLKESINCEADEKNLLKEIKLQKLGKWGREVEQSLIPSSE